MKSLYAKILLAVFTLVLSTSILAADPKGDALKKLSGKWIAVTLGKELPKFGFKTPANLVFNADGTFAWEYATDTAKALSTGKFEIVAVKKTYVEIDLTQLKLNNEDNEIKMVGIFTFDKKKNLQIIFYNEKFLARPSKFGADETQVYKKGK